MTTMRSDDLVQASPCHVSRCRDFRFSGVCVNIETPHKRGPSTMIAIKGEDRGWSTGYRMKISPITQPMKANTIYLASHSSLGSSISEMLFTPTTSDSNIVSGHRPFMTSVQPAMCSKPGRDVVLPSATTFLLMFIVPNRQQYRKRRCDMSRLPDTGKGKAKSSKIVHSVSFIAWTRWHVCPLLNDRASCSVLNTTSCNFGNQS